LFAKPQEKIIKHVLGEKVGRYSRKDLLIVSAILHDIGKPVTLITKSDGTTSCPAHEIVGSSLIPLFSKRLSLAKKEEYYIRKIVEYHSLIIDIQNQIIIKSKKEYYFNIYKTLVNDVKIELLLLHLSDLLVSDLNKTNPIEFEKRKKLTIDCFR
jgi:UTP:GlnB (protein PII) uridylyltransferase